MDRALEFYCDKLGFAVDSRKYYPDVVELKHEGIPLILYKVQRPAQLDYPNSAQILLSLETHNLDATLNELKSKGVDLLHETPQDCPVGVYVAIRDPFGNVLELLEFRS
jgi:catechol 2,3-dioxygenase-like lactoylglutathione lyase family enzyme